MDQFIIKSSMVIQYDHQSVINMIIEKLSSESDKRCLIDCALNRKWSKKEVLESSLNFGHYLINDVNISKGEVVFIASNNSDIHAIAFIGILAAGAVYSSAQNCPEFEMNGIITKIKPSLIICTDTNYEMIEGISNSKPYIKKILFIDKQSKSHYKSDEPSVEEIFQRTRDYNCELPVKTDLDDLATYVMTSGSTGQPKVIMRTNRNQLSMNKCVQHKELYSLTPEDIQLATGFCHISGQLYLMMSFDSGSTLAVLREENDPAIVIEAIHKYGITKAFLSPPRVNFIAKNYHLFDQDYLASLKYIMTGGGQMSETTLKIFSEKFSEKMLRNCYGMSEIGWATLVPVRDNTHINNRPIVGKVCPNVEMKVIDENEVSLPANTSGQICIRSSQVTPGYLDNDEENSKLFTKDGFLKSGDIGYYDDNHFFYIIGRNSNKMIVGSTNVMPEELEGILTTHPNVENAAVFGVKHETLNEVPFAFVTLTKGSAVSEQTLIDYLDSRVSYYKRLRGGLKILESFPLTPLMKINRRELKNILTANVIN